MIDKLLNAIKDKQNPSVVGLDPTLEMMPTFLKEEKFKKHGKTPAAVCEMFYEFNRRIIDSVYDIIPAVKPQIAMYEKYGSKGIETYIKTTEYAKMKGLIVIGDIKRGDISSTAEAYASHIDEIDIEGEIHNIWNEDFITINPYMGVDGIEPFKKACKKNQKGMFVLLKTSNPSSADIQDIIVDENPLYYKVGELIETWGEDMLGENGFSSIAAVVGATHPNEGLALREKFKTMFFLVPGYGVQGGKAEDLRGFFNENGQGAIINSSRGIIAAYKKDENSNGENFAEKAREATILMRDEISKVVKIK